MAQVEAASPQPRWQLERQASEAMAMGSACFALRRAAMEDTFLAAHYCRHGAGGRGSQRYTRQWEVC